MQVVKKYVFNPITLSYDEREESRASRILKFALSILTAVGLCYLYLWIYTSVLALDLPKTAILKKRNASWQSKISVVSRQLDLYERTLEGIENRDDKVYRSIFGMGTIPDEVKYAGLGGLNRYDSLDALGAGSTLRSIIQRSDILAKRSYLRSLSLDEVYSVSCTAGDMISHIPAVPPILPDRTKFRMSSPFGYRTDPVYGGRRMHQGQDFAAEIGYPVYATGDGIVEKTKHQFTGYGNEITIDHGFGYKTHYAHLSAIDVAPGMKIRRGERIGAVGRTGKATGPHLHYEVLYKGARVNPYGFMDLSMSVEEYKAMTDSRKEETSEPQKRKSTSELISGRKKR